MGVCLISYRAGLVHCVPAQLLRWVHEESKEVDAFGRTTSSKF